MIISYRTLLRIAALFCIMSVVIEVATQNYRCAGYAALCILYILMLIRDDIFTETMVNEIKRIIKGDNK